MRRTHCFISSTTLTETSGTGDYTLDASIIAAKTLRWSTSDGNQSYPERVPMSEIERMRATASTTSSVYPAAYYAVSGTTLSVYPTPSAADTVTIWRVPKPTEMSSGAHDTSNATYGGIPVEYDDALVLYAEWKAGSYRDDESSAQGERYRQLYEDEIKRIRKDSYLKGGRPGRAIFHPTRRRTPSQNDRYPGW